MYDILCWLLQFLQKGPSVADTVVGEGNTTSWKMCGLDKSTCLTVFFDLSSSERSNTPGTINPQLYLQFLTRYADLLKVLFSPLISTFHWWICLWCYCILILYCSYQNPEGKSMLRVTTVTRQWVDSAVSSEVSSVFFLFSIFLIWLGLVVCNNMLIIAHIF